MIKIDGSWVEGYAFDMHIIKSIYLGKNELGNHCYDTKRTPMGECLFKLKYGQYKKIINVEDIIKKIFSLLLESDFFKEFIDKMDIIIPTPPSNSRRRLQPTFLIARKIARLFNKEFYSGVLESKNKSQLKNILYTKRFEKLKDTIVLKKDFDKEKKVLIIDDIIQSGSTLKTIVEVFKKNGYDKMYVFALTKTKR